MLLSLIGLVRNKSMPLQRHLFQNRSVVYAVKATIVIIQESYSPIYSRINFVALNPSITGMLQSINTSLQFPRFLLQVHGSTVFYSILLEIKTNASFPLRALSDLILNEFSSIVYSVKILKTLSSTTRISLRLLQLQKN